MSRTHPTSGSNALQIGKPSLGAWTIRSEALKQLEDENAKLKTLLAEQLLDAFDREISA